ncbi:hypothetical protein SAY87_018330 [Trapa incisa]|uniref:GB1/RHD3-type G domain-containing protein n=1 Tax=Trapa incisa TaxID=236973 RepID=A0AAN7QWX2_9MYRT|nr:hypothetical protein SAY87_018330 [Trapa incisa]
MNTSEPSHFMDGHEALTQPKRWDMEAHSRSVQLIDEDGKFNSETLKSFTKTIQLNQCNSSYAVVSIMGPQSSGKSTLLNHLFGTKFQEMDASEGRSQTTKGIWMAKAVDIDPLTLIVDVEGNDGVERGEDDTKFEAQSALFVLAISDVVIINMWCHDVGREKAANRALLKITFQEMMRILTPRKATLMFVLRDKTKSPLDTLKAKLIRDVEKIWGSIWKPPAHVKTQLHEIFNIEVVALSNYEDKPENFKEEVDCLKRKFFRSTTPGGLAGDRSGAVPGSGFSINAEKLWQLIRQDQNLDLPSLKIMVSTHRCKQIAAKEFSSFDESKEWLQIRENIRTGLLSGSGKVLDALFDKTFER